MGAGSKRSCDVLKSLVAPAMKKSKEDKETAWTQGVPTTESERSCSSKDASTAKVTATEKKRLVIKRPKDNDTSPVESPPSNIQSHKDLRKDDKCPRTGFLSKVKEK